MKSTNIQVSQEEARIRAQAWFEIQGLSVSEWAAQNGFDRALVYALLAGRSRGRRGKAHEIAVALGLKPDCKVPLSDFVRDAGNQGVRSFFEEPA